MAAPQQKSEWVFFVAGVVVLLCCVLLARTVLGWLSITPDTDAGQRVKARQEIDVDNLRRLNTYAWRDQAGGAVQIPIERAMELTVAQFAAQPARPSGFSAPENPPDLSPDESYVSNKASTDAMQVGERIFTWNCALCHQLNGQGVAGQYPPLAGSEWVQAKNWHGDNHIVKIVLHGFQGPMTVNGQPFNNAMAPWGKLLTDDEIAAVLSYVRSQWGNDAPPITTEFVKKMRQQTHDRKEAWSQKELEDIGKEDVMPFPAATLQ